MSCRRSEGLPWSIFPHNSTKIPIRLSADSADVEQDDILSLFVLTGWPQHEC